MAVYASYILADAILDLLVRNAYRIKLKGDFNAKTKTAG